MSAAAMFWAWSVRDLEPELWLVLLALCDRADDEGYVWPSKVAIAKRVGWDTEVCSLMLKTLGERGLLVRDPDSLERGAMVANAWRVSFGWPTTPAHAGGSNKPTGSGKRVRTSPTDSKESSGSAGPPAKSDDLGEMTVSLTPEQAASNAAQEPSIRRNQMAVLHAFYGEAKLNFNALTVFVRDQEFARAADLAKVGAGPAEARQFVRWFKASGRNPTGLRDYERERASFLANPTGNTGPPRPERPGGSVRKLDAANDA